MQTYTTFCIETVLSAMSRYFNFVCTFHYILLLEIIVRKSNGDRYSRTTVINLKNSLIPTSLLRKQRELRIYVLEMSMYSCRTPYDRTMF